MPAPQTYSEGLARHYDQDYEILRRDAGDAQFYLSLAQQTGGPVLEVATGTGRVLLPMARAGLAVTGVDPTPEMLANFARKLAHEPAAVRARVTLAPGHFTAVDLPDGGHALVFSAFRAFQHLISDEEQRAALTEMARLLAPDGVLAFDSFDFDTRRARDFSSEHLDYVLEVGDERRERRSLGRLEGHVLEGRFRWLTDGRQIDQANFRMRVSTRDELAALVTGAGLELLDIYGDFDRSPWAAAIPRELIMVARKPAP